jgi:hypothetical protein
LSAATIEVRAQYPCSVAALWEELRHIDRHVNWMMDAESIEFLSDQVEDVGTEFVCLTKVGPFHTKDVLRITQWDPPTTMGVEHRGIVTGSGTFTLSPIDNDHVALVWREELRFPWWGLGGVGARVAKPILQRIWKGNLQRLGAGLS